MEGLNRDTLKRLANYGLTEENFSSEKYDLLQLSNQSNELLWEIKALSQIYSREAEYLIEQNSQFVISIQSLCEKVSLLNQYSNTMRSLLDSSMFNFNNFTTAGSSECSKLYDVDSNSAVFKATRQSSTLLEDLLPFVEVKNVSLMNIRLETPRSGVLVSDDDEELTDSLSGSGSGYEWEHGARVRNCTQLHWSLDAAIPRVRRQELIPRAKLRPDHQNIWRTMSSSSDAARRLSQHNLPEQSVKGYQSEARRSSKYDIYGTANKPFGENYRKSLIAQEQEQGIGNDKEREDSSVETDSVEEEMGCSSSRTQVAVNDETVKGNFANKETRNTAEDNAEDTLKNINKQIYSAYNNSKNNHTTAEIRKEKLSDLEIIYGSEYKYDNNDSGYSTSDIYSEVKKTDKPQDDSCNTKQSTPKTQREQLMEQIRDRRDGTKTAEENHYTTVARIQRFEEELEKQKNEQRKQYEEKTSHRTDSEPVSFVEEEYSYEPGKKEAVSKIVVRSRSLINLDQNVMNYNSTLGNKVKRPNELKFTSKSNEALRSEEHDSYIGDSENLRHEDGEIKSNYVSSIKNAFDTEIERNAQNKAGKAEAFDGLRQYFQDNKHGLQQLLTNNNVVIIEPFKHDPPRSPSELSETGSQRTCRITGATIKSPVNEQSKVIPASNTLPRRNVKFSNNNRPGFYHPIKVNKELIDTELPDPDKVKSVRELFESVLKSKSTSETPSKKQPFKSLFNSIASKMRVTPEVKVIQEGRHSMNDKKKHGRSAFDTVTKEDTKRYPLQRLWTDSGSLSSGVSSDFSCDQECEYHHNDSYQSGSNQEILEEYSSDEDDLDYGYPYDDDERHPVSSEVMQKIRACGTTITYYGGKVIAKSHGQCRSPMTMTIMDEIRQNGGTSENRKKFESDTQEPYLGVKFKLIKSHSCGSRLEIAGAEDEKNSKNSKKKTENLLDKIIKEEVLEVKEEPKKNTFQNCDSSAPTLEEEEDKVEADRYGSNTDESMSKSAQRMTWAELKLKEARKQWHCAPEAVRIPAQDMEFETFEVLDDTKPHKSESNETGRG